MLYWKIVMWQFSLHDYFSKTTIHLPIENPGHARFSLLHCMHPISGISRSLWVSFSKCNSLAWPQILHITPDIFLLLRILSYPYIYSQVYVEYYSKVTFRVMETNKFCLNSWLCLKNHNNFGIGLTPNSAIDFSIACKRQLQSAQSI